MRTNFCVICGSTSSLEHHHISPKVLGGHDSEENYITVCGEHHNKIHNVNKNVDHKKLIALGIDKHRLDRLSVVAGIIVLYMVDNNIFTLCFDYKIVNKYAIKLHGITGGACVNRTSVRRCSDIYKDDPYYFKWLAMDRKMGNDRAYYTDHLHGNGKIKRVQLMGI